MRKVLVFLIIVTQAQAVFAINCRDAIVEGHEALGKKIDRNSFSNSTFSDFNMSVDQFNVLSSEEQEEIYSKIRPIEVMVEQTISDLNRKIDRIAGTFYEIFMGEELELWRDKRDQLRSCSIE